MNKQNNMAQAALLTVACPYCNEEASIQEPENYAPVYAYCAKCDHKFIVERLSDGVQLFTIEDAPCSSDPNCREIEMGGGDEE